jgi:hypothetical protein
MSATLYGSDFVSEPLRAFLGCGLLALAEDFLAVVAVAILKSLKGGDLLPEDAVRIGKRSQWSNWGFFKPRDLAKD